MKKQNLLILCALCFSFFCKGANGGGSGEYTLTYNLKKGEMYKQNSESTIKMSMEMMGQSIDIQVETNVFVRFKVIDVKNDVFDLQLTYDRMVMTTEMSGGMAPRMSIDTENPQSVGQFAAVEKILKSMMEIPIDIQMSKQGKVIAISGFDRFLSKIAEVSGKTEDEMSKMMAEQTVKQQFSEKSVKSMFEQFQIIYPNHSLKIGDSWDTDITKLVNEMAMNGKLKYTLKTVEGNIATLEGSGIVEMKEQTVASPHGEAKVSVNGTFTTTTKISLLSGMPKSGDSDMKMDMKTTANAMEVPQKITMKTTLKTE